MPFTFLFDFVCCWLLFAVCVWWSSLRDSKPRLGRISPVSPAIYQRTIWPSDLSMLLKKIASKEHALKRTKTRKDVSKNSEVSSGYVGCLHDYTTHAHLWYPHSRTYGSDFFQSHHKNLCEPTRFSNAFSKCFRDFFGCFASNSGAKPYHVPEPHSAGRGGMGGMGIPQVVSSPLKGVPQQKNLEYLGIVIDWMYTDMYMNV